VLDEFVPDFFTSADKAHMARSVRRLAAPDRVLRLGVVLCSLLSTVVVAVAARVEAASPAGLQSVGPARLMDTRPGGITVDGGQAGAGAMIDGEQRAVQVAGRGGVPASGASAVFVNITVVQPWSSGFVTALAAPLAAGIEPTVASVGFQLGATTGSTTVVGLTGGGFTLFHRGAGSHVTVDVLGWIPADGSMTLTPARLADSRPGKPTVDGLHSGFGAIGADAPNGTTVDLRIGGRGGVPASGASAVLLSVTAVGATGNGYVTVFGAGTTRPPTSSLTVQAGLATTALVIVAPSSTGTVTVFNANGAADVVVDAVAWVPTGAPPAAIAGARVLDSRGLPTVDGRFSGGGQRSAGQVTTIDVLGRGSVPAAGVGAVVVNVTSVAPATGGYVTAFPAEGTPPTASSLNVRAGRTGNNLVVVPLGTSNQLSLFSSTAMHLVVDVVGWLPGRAAPPSGPELGGDHPRIYLSRNLTRLQALVTSGTPSATRFTGLMAARRSNSYQSLYDANLSMWQFALMAKLNGDNGYCTFAVAGVDWFVAREEAAINAGQQPIVAGDSYLEVGPLIGDLATVYDWCYAQVSATQRTRWIAYADQAVWNVWNHTQARWGTVSRPWSGWSVDNPANNYYYSFLRATMLLGLATYGESANAATWIATFRTAKIADQLVPTFNRDLVGGGSREGTGYGTAMMRLWEVYDLWEGSTGENIASLTGHTRASLVNFMHYVVPTRNAVSLNGDHSRDSTGAFFDYHRHFAQSLAKVTGDPLLAARARDLVDRSSIPRMTTSFMYVHDFLYDMSWVAASPPSGAPAMNTVSYAPGIGQAYGRSSWSTDATWWNATGGPYTESHAHRDQTGFLVFKRGWLAYDPNYHSHSGIEQNEELHNIVRINASDGRTLRQWEGASSTVLAVTQGAGFTHVAIDATAVYRYRGDTTASLVQREFVYLPPNVLVVYDRVTTVAGSTQTWQLNVPVAPTVAGSSATVTNAGSTLTSQRIIPSAATMSTFDWAAAGGGEFSGGYRIDETVSGGANTMLHVLALDGAVTASARADADGRQGVTLTLSDGRVATVRFSPTAVDATLEIRNAASGAVLVTSALSAGIRPPTELAP
jgi:hypothetical protein